MLALPFIEADGLFSGMAARSVNEFDPAVRFAIYDLQAAERRICAFLIQPVYEFLKMLVDGDRSWFVNELKPALQSRDENGPALAVRVPCAGRGFRQRVTFGIYVEKLRYFRPIGSQAAKKLFAVAYPMLNAEGETARQNGIFREQLQRCIPAT